jgi:tetratricopeptide (TPR) repeat protein
MHPGLQATLAAALVTGLLQPASVRAQESARDRAGWWVASFGATGPGESRAADRARAVFERVRASADKNGKRFPRLVVLRKEAGAFAVALPDGTVLITPEGIALCDQGVAQSSADARLAFVLGHELAHLAHDDFWHAAAAAPEPLEEERAKELRADSYGLLYMALAGYPPEAVLQSASSFLEQWVASTVPETQFASATHPRPAERAALLRTELRAVGDDLDLFQAGVRLLQIGHLEDAVLFLERFRDRFPSREVFNNLGLAHYQIARRALIACDPEAALRLRLPVRLDPETRAPRTPRGGGAPCAAAQVVATHAAEAVRLLQRATELDPAYATGAVNLAAALVLAERPAQALAAAESALSTDPGNVDALNARAVALHLYGSATGVDTLEPVLGILRELRRAYPRDPASAYNLAAVLGARGRTAAARDAWDAFLQIEPAGVWADLVRRQTGQPPRPPLPLPSVVPEAPPVPLGRISAQSSARLAALARRTVDLGAVSAVLYRGQGLRVLELDGSVEFVEEELGEPAAVSVVLARRGAPQAEIAGSGGTRTMLYRRLAFDVAGDRVVRRVFLPDPPW